MAKDNYKKGTHTIDLNASLVKLNLDDTPPINNLDETRPIVKPTKQIVAKQPVAKQKENKPVQTNTTVVAKQETKSSAPRLQSIKYKSKQSPFVLHKATNKTENNNQKENKSSKTSNININTNTRITYDTNKVLGTSKVTVSGINKALKESNKTNENSISNFIEMAVGGVRRQLVKDIINTDNNEKQSKKSLITKSKPQAARKIENKYPPSVIDTIPMTKDNVLHFAQTFKPTSNHYYAAENINLNEVKLGYRSRGSREPIKSQGIIATTYSNGDKTFLPLKNMQTSTPKGDNNWNSGYIGVDKNGKFVAGNYLDTKSKADHIKRGAVVASTPYCRIYNFDKDANGKFISIPVPGISRSRKSPRMTIDFGDNKQRKAPINILLGRNGESNLYGEITGGRIIFKYNDEIRLVSGSIDQIYSVFQDMKKRHKAKYIESYQLDNGTFNKAIRTKNGVLDSETLRMYDLQNETGGNGLYLK